MLAITVDTPLDVIDSGDNLTSLREAIAIANTNETDADTVNFDASLSGARIQLSGTELKITETLTIDASALDQPVTIDANQQSRVLSFTDSFGDLTLNGLVIIRGHSISFGGGISFRSSRLLTLNDVIVSENSSALGGGGIHSFSGDVSLDNSTVSGNNSASNGGGVYSRDGIVTLNTSTVSGNFTTGENADGGGIYTDTGKVTINYSTVSENSTAGDRARGGGIRSGGRTLIYSSTISGNSSAYGGGVYSQLGVTLSGSTITHNTASNRGGGLLAFAASASISPPLTILNSIVAENTDSGFGPDVRPESGAEITVNYSLIGNTTGSRITPTTGIDNILNVEPLLGSLTDNGGPTLTHALLPGSPAIDAANQTFLVDQLARPRAVDFSSIPNTANGSDIGAYELQMPVNEFLLPTNVVVTTETESNLDLSEAVLIEEDTDSVTVTLAVDTGTFSVPIDGSIVGAGVTAILVDPQTITLTGAAVDINTYFDEVSNLMYTTALGAIGENAATIGITLDDGQAVTDSGSINVDVVERNSLQVTNATDLLDPFDEETSLREAINFANTQAGIDTIAFDSEIFTGGTNSLIRLTLGELEITEALTIDASTVTDVVVTGDANDDDITLLDTPFTDVSASHVKVDGNVIVDLLSDNSRVLNFKATSGNLMLRHLTITGGRAQESGGGILFGDPFDATLDSLILDQSVIIGNSSTFRGGGIYAKSGAVTLNSSTISGNTSSDDGGGVFNYTGQVKLTNSTVSGNISKGLGGGIMTGSGVITLVDSVVSDNITTGRGGNGGGIWVSSGAVKAINSSINGNVASGEGGGIWNASGIITSVNSLVSRNSSGSDGGGIWTHSGEVTLDTSTLSGNRATSNLGEGGGIWNLSSDVTITGSTIADNTSLRGGGGIHIDGFLSNSRVSISNSIIANNSSSSFFTAAPDLLFVLGTVLSVDYSLIGDTTRSGITEATGAGNLLDINPLLGPLVYNGGHTQTHALLPGSPALNAGDSSIPFLATEADQRGVGYSRVAFDRIDIGAYEAQVTPSGDFDRDGDVDGSDLLAWQRGFGMESAVRTDGNSDDDTDVDASDLTAWQISFGRPQPLIAPTDSGQEIAASRQSAMDIEELIDAALAMEWMSVDDDELATPLVGVQAQAIVEQSVATLEVIAHIESADSSLIVESEATKKYDQPWLADELLERVFS